MKYLLLLTFLTFTSLTLRAQESGKGIFKFLEIPISPHAAALGGNNISVIDDDLSLINHNPGLLGKEMDKMLSLNYTFYVGDIHIGNAMYAKSTERMGTFAFGLYYMDYGTMDETTPENTVIGDFSVKDMMLNGFYSYDFTEKWRGGVNAKFIYSHYADFNSFGIAVDLGLSYYDPDSDFSLGFVLKNMGGQIKAYDDEYEKIPWDVQLGITKQLAHAPFKISVTLQNMREWDLSYRSSSGGIIEDKEKNSFMDNLMSHILLGVDFTPGKNFYASLGYNYRRRNELKAGEKAGLTGFSAGAGLVVKSFRIGFAAAQYHVSGLSYHFNVTKNFAYQ